MQCCTPPQPPRPVGLALRALEEAAADAAVQTICWEPAFRCTKGNFLRFTSFGLTYQAPSCSYLWAPAPCSSPPAPHTPPPPSSPCCPLLRKSNFEVIELNAGLATPTGTAAPAQCSSASASQLQMMAPREPLCTSTSEMLGRHSHGM